MPQTTHDIFPTLSTSRLTLRKLKDDDVQAVFALRSSEVVCRYIARPASKHIDEAREFIDKIKQRYEDNSSYYWVICAKDNDELMGSICLWNFSEDQLVAELGYEMLPQHHGKGYMNEALEAVCAYGFNTLGLTAIEAFTHHDNTPSRNLLEKNNFTLCEGRKDEDVETNVVYRKKQEV